jgi:hypothetical protein
VGLVTILSGLTRDRDECSGGENLDPDNGKSHHSCLSKTGFDAQLSSIVLPNNSQRPVVFFRSYPTPADWPKGGVLPSGGGPCVSAASWRALLCLATISSNLARWGVIGFGSFCRNKRASAAGPKPGIYHRFKNTRLENKGNFLLAK